MANSQEMQGTSKKASDKAKVHLCVHVTHKPGRNFRMLGLESMKVFAPFVVLQSTQEDTF